MKKLETLLFVAVAAILVAACGPYSKLSEEQQKAVDKKLQAAYVRAIEKPDVTVMITQLIPRGLPAKTTNVSYKLTLKGDVVDTRLPFIGTSHTPTYGGADEISVVFDDEKVDLQKDFSKADKGQYIYKFKGGEGFNKWEMTLELYDDGNARIDANCTDGRSMSYYGNIVLKD